MINSRPSLPNFHKTASIGLSIPVSTASVDRSFSQIKMIKAPLRNFYVTVHNNFQLMRIVVEALKVVPEIDIGSIVNRENQENMTEKIKKSHNLAFLSYLPDIICCYSYLDTINKYKNNLLVRWGGEIGITKILRSCILQRAHTPLPFW